MITADELLEQAAAMAETRTAIPENEMHIVVDSNRYAIVPDILKNIAVQRDHNIETVTFDCPRYWDGHDLLDLELKIVWERADGYSEPHLVENLRVDEIDSTILHFEWTITNKVTAIPGKIKFSVCGKLTDADGVLEREWHTHPNEEMYTAEGMDCSGEEILDSNPDILNAILTRIALLEGTGKHGGAPFIEAWLSEELAKRQQLAPEFANSIGECIDPHKLYVLPDGYIYAYMMTEVAEGGYTNQVGTSKNGFLSGYRMKAITDEPAAVSGSDASTAFVSNIFPCKKGDIIRIRGVGRSETDSATAPVFMVVPVNSSGAVITNHGFCLAAPAYTGPSLFAAWKQAWDKAAPAEDGTITWEYAVNNSNENKADNTLAEPTTAVRLAGVALNGFDNIIVTVNEEIVDPVIVKDYRWTNTGRAFVSADYEDRIAALEDSVADMGAVKERTTALENDVSAIKEALPFNGLLNHGIFDYAYIKNGELVANALDVDGNQHGHYTGVEMSGHIKRIMCKAKITAGASVVLISTRLGSTVVSNIVRGSIHVIFNSNGCSVGIYDGGDPPGALRTVATYNCPVSEGAVVPFGYAVDESANTMTIYLPDDTTRTLTDDAVGVINGEYAIWEHYTNTSAHGFVCCKITKLWCEDANGDVLDDDLKRLDGAIGVAPTGQVYRQFRTGHQVNRNFT